MAAAFLFSFFLSLSVHSLNAASQTTTNAGETQILLRIKQDWGNPSVLADWDTSTDSSHCAWPGVKCGDDGSVIEITFRRQNSSDPTPPFSDPIPPSLCDLKNLSHLDLYYNNIPGPFPTVLYNCTNLQYLDISENRFVGEIPSDVQRLSPKLAFLYLSANNFSGDVPASFGQLPMVQELWLDNNLFNGSFPAELGNLSNLKGLALAWNPFAPMSLPPKFGNLTKLSYLWMSQMNLEGEIPPTFAKLASMQHLDLSTNSLTGAIPAGIWALENLTYLFLYHNSLSGPIMIDGTIKALGLEQIDLSMNKLNGSIPDDFGKLQNLSLLFMYYNQFSGEIPTSIALLPSLSDLRLLNNRLTGVLPSELGKYSPLYDIEVSENEITGELPEHLCAQGQLTSIVVSNNQMTGNIPASLGSCITLNNIMLENNKFYGQVPEGMWTAVNLTTVLMRNNTLNGTLPDKLPWNLTRVEIQNNRFSGKIPSLANNLQVFRADHNLFSGELPSDLTGIGLLQSLSLSGNQISGSIPDDISVLKSLSLLDLSHNQISGDIPAGIGSLPVLTWLDLSSNNLSGPIPSEIDVLKLSFLNLSSNDLSGKIPSSLQSPAYDQSFFSNPSLCATNALLNVPTCRLQSNGSNGLSSKLLIILLTLGALIVLVAVTFAFFVIRDYRRRKDGEDLAAWKLTSFQSLDFSESNILRGLREDNLIGSGGSGMVYKINLGNRAGGIVAVKRIWNGRKLDSKLVKEFLAEVQILSSIRHTNIVKLLCCISNVDSKLLVYEYMENGSLDRWLHKKSMAAAPPIARTGSAVRNDVLDWPSRLRIAIGSARGLCYMHHDCSPPVIHRDVKSSNILLDSEFRARIADFGLARILVKRGQADTVSTVAGSFGYMAPECAYSKVNEKVDVYSFGVVLLELTTGREASDGGDDSNLAQWAWGHLQEGKRLADALDEEIKGPAYLTEMEEVFKLGLICTGTLPSTRPSMKEVLQFLLRYDIEKDDKPQMEHDVAPLLHKVGSRHKKASIVNEDGNDDRFQSEV